MAVDLSLYIGPLLVSGIAGLSLTPTVFKSPFRMIEIYNKLLNIFLNNNNFNDIEGFVNSVESNDSIGGSAKRSLKNIKNNIKNKSYLENFDKRFKVRNIDLYEIIVIFLFVILELSIAFTYFEICFDNYLDQYNNMQYHAELTFTHLIPLSLGYVILLINILIILRVYYIGLRDASFMIRAVSVIIGEEKFKDTFGIKPIERVPVYAVPVSANQANRVRNA